MEINTYLGEWSLVPELSIYQTGDAPASGRYVIRDAGEQLEFEIYWTDGAGENHEIAYSGIPDGKKYTSEAPGVSHVMFERISEQLLDSTAYDGDDVLMYARRAASKTASCSQSLR